VEGERREIGGEEREGEMGEKIKLEESLPGYPRF
jgi:hypothetical protein